LLAKEERTDTMRELHGCSCKQNSWTAVLDATPPNKPRLTVKGVCTCPTGGFKASLKKAEPQGINSEVLLLELVTDPPSGAANQMVTDYSVIYEQKDSPKYTNVTIRPCDLTIDVTVVS
jgi:hypothetical protein